MVAQVQGLCPQHGPSRYLLIKFQQAKYSLSNGIMSMRRGGQGEYPHQYYVYHDKETFRNRENSFANSLLTLCGSGPAGDMQISSKFSPTHLIGTLHPESAFIGRETVSKRGQDLMRSARPASMISGVIKFVCPGRSASVLNLGQDFEASWRLLSSI